MKKFELFGSIVTIFSFLFFSCNNLAYDITVSPNHTVRRTVTITVTSNSNLLSFPNNNEPNLISQKTSRTIAPAAISSSNLNFYLGGKDVLYNKKLTVQKVNFHETQPQQGKITLELDSSSYYLTLIAIKKDTDNIVLNNNTHIEDLLENAVLCGNTTADLLYCDSTTPIVFYMTTDGLHGEGKYDFSFYLQNWSTQSLASDRGDKVCQTIQDVEAGIYQKNSLIGEKTSLAFSSHQTEDSVLSYTGTLPAGSYELRLTFIKDKKKFSYVEDFVIIPGQTTSSILGIPDLLMNPPAPPTDFIQGYVLASDSNSDYYYLIFNWKDNSNTEDYFEIQIQDENSNTVNVTPTTVIDENAWNTQLETYTSSYGQDFYGSKNWYAGDLDKNSTWAIFYMPLGSRYISRIRSVNQAGGSSWCYGKSGSPSVTIEAGKNTAEEVSLPYSKKIIASPFYSDIINLYRLKYNLNGGTFNSTIPTIYYFSQTTDGIPIMTPDGATTNSIYNSGNTILLSKNETTWKNWRRDFFGGEIVDVKSNYKGFENLNLYADYFDLPAAVDNNDYSIENNLSFSVESSGSGNQPSLSLNENKVEFDRTNDNYSIDQLIFAYSYKNENIHYSKLQLILSNDESGELGVFDSSINTFSIPVNNLNSGSYDVVIKAFISNNPIPYKYSFQIIMS